MKNKPSDELLEVAQEITFAKALASNDKTLRDKALRRLRKWIESKSEASKSFTEDGLVRLWRGLFYNVWMSDKPLVQEEVVEGVSNLVHCFIEYSDAVGFIKCFFHTLSDTWFGLDSHRFDKYLMFVRRFLRQSFKLMEKYSWNQKHVLELVAAFEQAFTNAPLGFIMHICEIFLEELAKVSKGNLDRSNLTELIKPFGVIMSRSSDARLINHIGDFIYLYLLKQSDLGIKHEIKFNAWKKIGCPEGNINVMQEVEMDAEEEVIDDFEDDNISLDARAGHVDVILPLLKFDTGEIVEHLTMLKKHSSTTTRARKRLADLINKFKTFERGKYPLGIHKVTVIPKDDEYIEIEKAAEELMEEEMEIFQRDKPPSKNKPKRLVIPDKGEWLITPIKESNSQNGNELFDRSLNVHNSWQVSNTPVKSVKSDEPSTTILQAKPKEANKNKKRLKRKKKTRKNLSITSEPLQRCIDENVKKNEDVNAQNDTDDWGNVPWDDVQETEIVIEPKKKWRHSDVLPQTNSVRMNCKKPARKSTSGVTSSRKKVEFVLNRNSVQDEEDYKRSLKKNPKIKFDGDVQPPLGVLKSTPFSSPVNPFFLPAANV